MKLKAALLATIALTFMSGLISSCASKEDSLDNSLNNLMNNPIVQAGAAIVAQYQAVLDNADRPAADKARDEARKALDTLMFANVQAGMKVMDMEAGGGYFTELLSISVGPNGQVIMQNPAGFAGFLRDALAARFANGRLANVRQSASNFDALDAADNSLDRVLWVQGPHELYYHPESGPLGDAAKSFAEIYRILKPGGSFIVVDHNAAAGSPETTGNSLHRIDPAITTRMAVAAGFRASGSADFLLNPADPMTQNVFDPAIRGHTSQHVLRFTK